MDEIIEVWVNGRLVHWPKREYLDYVAWQHGFEDYDDLLKHGYTLKGETSEGLSFFCRIGSEGMVPNSAKK